MVRTEIEVEKSSGNVFEDLGFDDEEAGELLAKADLAIQIAKAIKERRLTPTEAARELQIDRAKVSKILNGHLADFAIGRLLTLLRRLNRDVTISVTARTKGAGRMRVLGAAVPMRAAAKRAPSRTKARA